MGLITVGSGKPENQLDEGTYAAVLQGVAQKTIKDPKTGEDKDVFEWVWGVPTENEDGTPGEPIVLNGLTSLMTGPKSKTFATLVALLGPDAVTPTTTFEVGDLVGKSGLVKVIHNDAGYAKVSDAMPLPKSMAKPTVKEQAIAAPAAPGANSAATAVPAAVAAEASSTDDDGLDDLPF